MNITVTSIPDINRNLETAKTDLGERVFKGISPLLDEFYVGKINEITNLKTDFKNIRKEVIDKKELLEGKLSSLEKKKKVKKLLEKISKLITAGLAYDSSFKNEAIVLLKVIDNLPDEKLDFHMQDITKTISSRFSK